MASLNATFRLLQVLEFLGLDIITQFGRQTALSSARPGGGAGMPRSVIGIQLVGAGLICFRGRKVNLSRVFAGQSVGVTQVGERIWLVTFMQYDLGYFDDEMCRLEPIDNPFGPRLLPIRSE